MTDPAEKLQQLFASLNDADQQSLLAFAEFLQQRGADSPSIIAPVARPSLSPQADVTEEPATPEDIPRPESESVIKAVKRLSATYPMLNKNALLNETSDLVTQHVVLGRERVEVIDELEIVFQNRYREYLAAFSSDGEDQ